MIRKTIYLSVLFGLFVVSLHAQEIPPIQIFTPQEYNAEHQNWAIAQSSNKYIYAANNKGLLEYNGANWNLYPSPNETILRSVAVIAGKIYTGCYMEFGYWVKNEFGLLEYTSLKPFLKEEMIEDEQIWKIIPLDDWILFQSLDRIYLYNILTSKFKIISSETKITKMFLVDDTIMFQKINKGIYKIENGEAKLITSNSLIKDDPVVNIFSFEGDNYLIQTVSKGFYLFNENQLIKWETQANDLLNDISVYNSIRLRDGSYVLGTISNGVIHLTNDGKLNYKISQSNGLGNNTVLSLFEDVDQDIWLGLDNGINCINMKSPFRIYNDQEGKLGTIYSSVLFQDWLYLGTNQGLFYKKTDNDSFEFVEGTEGQVWNLKLHDDTLFCCHNEGTFVVKGNKVELVSEVPGTWDIKPIKNSPNMLLQGNYSGLNVIEKQKNGRWRFKNSIEGFSNSSRFFEIGPDNSIFVGHEYKGVYKIEVDKTFSKAEEVSKILELPKALYASLVNYNNDYLYSFEEGIFKYHNDVKEFKKDTLLSAVFNKSNYVTGRLIVDAKNNRFWCFSEQDISYVSPGKLSSQPKINKIPIPSYLRNGMTGFENITHLRDDTYLFGETDGYLLVDLKHSDDTNYNVGINSVKKGRRGVIDTAVSLTANEAFKNSENNVEFAFSVPEYQQYSQTMFSYQLVGIYDEWTKWSTNSKALFENLPYGNYTFNVSAKVGNKVLKEEASYEFRINRPWHLSNLMIFVYTLLTIGTILFINYLYKRYYRKQREKLLEKTQRELALKELENEQQLMRFRNESLRKDIESKNRELAISTMSLIKKNEFLNNIKQELNATEDNQKLKPVIKIIDKNLNNTDDWKFFQEAFNNADKDFLKKMKSMHPKLTPNDLRLCAYLRLNLSSKEIAPLLNISHRSVEVKRYRLRKKMNLPHEASLTNYILEI